MQNQSIKDEDLRERRTTGAKLIQQPAAGVAAVTSPQPGTPLQKLNLKGNRMADDCAAEGSKSRGRPLERSPSSAKARVAQPQAQTPVAASPNLAVRPRVQIISAPSAAQPNDNR